MWNLKYDTSELMYKTKIASQKTDLWFPLIGEGEREGPKLGLVDANR